MSDFGRTLGSLKPKLGEARMHPQVYGEIRHGGHADALRHTTASDAMAAKWGEFDVIVTAEIPVDRVVFVYEKVGLQEIVMLDGSSDPYLVPWNPAKEREQHDEAKRLEELVEMREIERLRRQIEYVQGMGDSWYD